MVITVLDYGAGNLHSLVKALGQDGVRVVIEADPVRAVMTDLLVLPGVGAYAAAARHIAPARTMLRDALRGGLPCLGVCLGMQLLLDESDESAGDDGARGIGLIPGRVERLRAPRVPHMGWNALTGVTDPLLRQVPLEMAYFANSYVCRPTDDGVVCAWTTHAGARFPSAVRVGNTVGVQFHPEKSSAAGLRFIALQVEAAARRATDRDRDSRFMEAAR